MFLTELCKQAFRDMRSHKMRSVLAVFGIVWGTVAVVLLLALGQGFYIASKASMASFSQGTLLAYTGPTSLSRQGLSKGSTLHIKTDDLDALRKAVPNIAYITPILVSHDILYYKNQQAAVDVFGVSPDYDQLVKFGTTREGRFINPLDVKQKQHTIFLLARIKNKLFGNESAIGKTVTIEGVPYTVVGSLHETVQTSIGFQSTDSVFIPYTTWQQHWGNSDVLYFFFMGKDLNNTKTLQRSMMQYLAFEHQFDPADKTALQFWNTAELSQFVDWFLRAIQLFLGFCGVMTLGVGGVGLANTMYLIVTQRTSEIGLRMALGARDWQIMLQFLFESSLLVFIGSVIGFIISAICLTALQYVSLPQWIGTPEASLSVIVSTVIILSIVALAAGYFPARRAAQMTPMEALSF